MLINILRYGGNEKEQMKHLFESKSPQANRTRFVVLAMVFNLVIFMVMSSPALCSALSGNAMASRLPANQDFLTASSGSSNELYPEPIGNINDFAGVLSEADVQSLQNLVDVVLQQTGVTIAVVIVEDHGEESLEMYAANLYERWGIGQQGEDMGLLLLLSVEEREVRMEVGYGLEPVITDGIAGECLDVMVTYFADGDYGRGLYEGLRHAAQYIAESQGVELDLSANYEQPVSTVGFRRIAALGVVGALILVFALLAYSMNRKRRCPRCKSKLVYTDKVVQQATQLTPGLVVKIAKCPVCGYHKESTYRANPIGSSSGLGGPLPPPTRTGTGFGGFFRGGGGGSAGRSSGPKGFGGGRSGGGGASRKW